MLLSGILQLQLQLQNSNACNTEVLLFIQLKMSCSDCKCPFCVEYVYQFEVKTTLFCKMMFVLLSMKICLDFVTIPRRSLLNYL